MRKYLFLLFGLPALVLAVGYLLLWLTAPPRVDDETLEAIREGMTAEEVRRLVGGGPHREYPVHARDDKEGFPTGAAAEWKHLGLTLRVAFDGGGRVFRKELFGVEDEPERARSNTLLAKLRRWLGIAP